MKNFDFAIVLCAVCFLFGISFLFGFSLAFYGTVDNCKNNRLIVIDGVEYQCAVKKDESELQDKADKKPSLPEMDQNITVLRM